MRRTGRITPTCVGKRPPHGARCCGASDHPHVRGEKHDAAHALRVQLGSSPRAWGKCRDRRRRWGCRRIIPTCVGKSARRADGVSAEADHPHVRGEKADRVGHLHLAPGSSPRAWGKDLVLDEERGHGRIIPTCVGKRITHIPPNELDTDHPHVRGEKLVLMRFAGSKLGSSPRAWGKVAE